MGQQQLLLVILVTIIVGIATVVAINVFGSSAKNANVDAARQDLLTIGSEAQGYYMKPTMMGGGGNTMHSINFNNLGFGYDSSKSNIDVYNSNGEYTITAPGKTDTAVTVTALPSQAPHVQLTATIGPSNIQIQKTTR